MDKNVKIWKYFLLSTGIIIIDQIVKLTVHFNMERGAIGEIPVIGDWFKLHYTTNPGMAFGMELAFDNGKLVLTLFRLIAMVAIGWYLYHLAKRKMHPGLLWSIALILGGAIGNVVDSIFYGALLGIQAPGTENPWFHGMVVDMFYIDIWEGQIPAWVPFAGGDWISLWPIFNIADASIFIGVTIILVMQRKFFHQHEENKESVASASEDKSEPSAAGDDNVRIKESIAGSGNN